jgi:hypothetical protein
MRRFIFPIFAFTTLLAACSSSSSGGTTPTGGGSAPIPPDPAKKFDVPFYAIQNAGQERLVMASFVVGTSSGVCTTETVAGCAVTTCDASGAPTTATPIDGGSFSASSPSLGTDVALTMQGGYGRIVQPGAFAEGEQVRLVSTGGADIPAIDQTVTIPANVTGLSVDGCTSTSVDSPCAFSSAGATVSWSGGAGAIVGVGIASTLQTAHTVSVSCQFDGNSGSGRVPGEALAKLTGLTNLTLGASPRSTLTTVSGSKYAAGVYAIRFTGEKALAVKAP